MLKKISWVIAALFVASAMIFIGCPTELGGKDDGTKPVDPSLPEVVLEGDDIVLTKIGNGGGSTGTTVDGNKFKLNATGATGTGFSIDFPAEVKGKVYKEIVVEMEVIAITSPDFISFNAKEDNQMGTDILIVGHTQQYHNEFKIGTVVDKDVDAACSNDTCLKYTPGTCVVGATGKAAYPYEKFPKELIAFQYNPYAGDITNSPGSSSLVSNFEIAVTKVTFVPYKGEPPAPEVAPTFGGGAGKVVYTKTGTPEVETVVDSDPLINGVLGMTVSSDGYFKFDKSGRIHYKFPESATGFTGDPKLEADWDFVKVEYLVKGVVIGKDEDGNEVATAKQAKTKIIQYETADDTYTKVTGGEWQSLALDGTADAPSVLNLQTWGSGGKGGFSIRINDWDLVSGGGTSNECADVFEVKIVKVTFTKGARYKVEFFTPDVPSLNNIAPVTVLGTNGLDAAYPALSNPGWVFLGWYDAWGEDATTGIGVASGTEYPAGKAITGALKLYAKWQKFLLPEFTYPTPATTTDTLFGAVGSYAESGATYTVGEGASAVTVTTTAAAKYVYPATGETSKSYWIVAGTTTSGTAPNQVVGGGGYQWDKPAGTFATTDAAVFTAIKTAQMSYGANAIGNNPGYTRIGITAATVSSDWLKYTKVTLTYDMIPVGGDDPLNVRLLVDATNSSTAVSYPNLEAGVNKTITLNTAQFTTGIGITKNNNGAMLLRISKITLHY
jgi:hypothetical protein